MTINTISPRQLFDLAQAGTSVDLIDVRTPAEFREAHVGLARNVPLDQLDVAKYAASHEAARPLYVICRSGARSRKACEKFAAAGFSNIVNIDGGTLAWEQAGLPVARGKKSISLERQVRIAAGLIVLTASLLSAFVSVYWIGLAAFVGAGLIFAGITDTCAMGMLLARMPWNQVAGSGSSSTACATNANNSCCS